MDTFTYQLTKRLEQMAYPAQLDVATLLEEHHVPAYTSQSEASLAVTSLLVPVKVEAEIEAARDTYEVCHEVIKSPDPSRRNLPHEGGNPPSSSQRSAITSKWSPKRRGSKVHPHNGSAVDDVNTEGLPAQQAVSKLTFVAETAANDVVRSSFDYSGDEDNNNNKPGPPSPKQVLSDMRCWTASPTSSFTGKERKTPLLNPDIKSSSLDYTTTPMIVLGSRNSEGAVQDRVHKMVEAFQRRTDRNKAAITRPSSPDTLTDDEDDVSVSVDTQARLDSLLPDMSPRPTSWGMAGERWGDRLKRGCRLIRRKLTPSPAIEPTSRVYVAWLIVASSCYTYNAIVIPLRAVFSQYQSPDNLRTWMSCDYLCDAVYLLDILLFNFRVKFIDNGFWVGEPALIRKYYSRSTRFKFGQVIHIHTLAKVQLFRDGDKALLRDLVLKLQPVIYLPGDYVCTKIDLLSLLPLDLFYLLLGPNVLLRLPRLLKIQVFWEAFNRLDSILSSPHIVRLTRTVMYMLYMIHLNCCAYYTMSITQGLASDDWVFSGEGHSYVRCFYFATKTVSSIGKNPRPTNDLEFVFMTISWLGGVFIFALLIGQIRDIMATATRASTEYRAVMDATQNYLQTMSLPKDLQDRIKLWFTYTWQSQKTLDENSALDHLPKKMHTDVALSVHIHTLAKVQLFRDCDKALLRDLVLKLQPVIYLPGDYVCTKGEVGKEMYIIQSGQVQVVGGPGNNTVFATLGEGSVFGEVALLAVGGGNRRTADVRSSGFSNLFVLSKSDLHETIRDYPEAQEILRKKARRLLKQAVVQAQPKQRPEDDILFPNREQTPQLMRAVLQAMRQDSYTASVIRRTSRSLSVTTLETHEEGATPCPLHSTGCPTDPHGSSTATDKRSEHVSGYECLLVTSHADAVSEAQEGCFVPSEEALVPSSGSNSMGLLPDESQSGRNGSMVSSDGDRNTLKVPLTEVSGGGGHKSVVQASHPDLLKQRPLTSAQSLPAPPTGGRRSSASRVEHSLPLVADATEALSHTRLHRTDDLRLPSHHCFESSRPNSASPQRSARSSRRPSALEIETIQEVTEKLYSQFVQQVAKTLDNEEKQAWQRATRGENIGDCLSAFPGKKRKLSKDSRAKCDALSVRPLELLNVKNDTQTTKHYEKKSSFRSTKCGKSSKGSVRFTKDASEECKFNEHCKLSANEFEVADEFGLDELTPSSKDEFCSSQNKSQKLNSDASEMDERKAACLLAKLNLTNITLPKIKPKGYQEWGDHGRQNYLTKRSTGDDEISSTLSATTFAKTTCSTMNQLVRPALGTSTANGHLRATSRGSPRTQQSSETTMGSLSPFDPHKSPPLPQQGPTPTDAHLATFIDMPKIISTCTGIVLPVNTNSAALQPDDTVGRRRHSCTAHEDLNDCQHENNNETIIMNYLEYKDSTESQLNNSIERQFKNHNKNQVKNVQKSQTQTLIEHSCPENLTCYSPLHESLAIPQWRITSCPEGSCTILCHTSHAAAGVPDCTGGAHHSISDQICSCGATFHKDRDVVGEGVVQEDWPRVRHSRGFSNEYLRDFAAVVIDGDYSTCLYSPGVENELSAENENVTECESRDGKSRITASDRNMINNINSDFGSNPLQFDNCKPSSVLRFKYPERTSSFSKNKTCPSKIHPDALNNPPIDRSSRDNCCRSSLSQSSTSAKSDSGKRNCEEVIAVCNSPTRRGSRSTPLKEALPIYVKRTFSKVEFPEFDGEETKL